MPGVELHARNAAAMWESLASACGEVIARTRDVSVTEPSPYHSLRAILLRWPQDPEAVARMVTGLVLARDVPRRTVEDAFGVLPMEAYGFVARDPMAVMVRDPGPVPGERPEGVEVVRVTDPDQLAVTERVIVDGFPQTHLQPWVPGRSLPPQVLGLPGWTVWLARREGQPAGGGYVYDDTAVGGAYWIATLPEHRGKGVARALVRTMLENMPDRPMTLTATAAGEPLYRSLGFGEVSRSWWWNPT